MQIGIFQDIIQLSFQYPCAAYSKAWVPLRNKSAPSTLHWHNYVQHVAPAAVQVIRIHHPSAAFRELAFIIGTVVLFDKKSPTTIIENNLKKKKRLKAWDLSHVVTTGYMIVCWFAPWREVMTISSYCLAWRMVWYQVVLSLMPRIFFWIEFQGLRSNNTWRVTQSSLNKNAEVCVL